MEIRGEEPQGQHRTECQLESGAHDLDRIDHQDDQRGDPEDARRTPAPAENDSDTQAERADRRACHRRLGLDNERVGQEEEEGKRLSEPWMHADGRDENRDRPGQHGEVEAGDGDQVRKARLGEGLLELGCAGGVATKEHRPQESPGLGADPGRHRRVDRMCDLRSKLIASRGVSSVRSVEVHQRLTRHGENCRHARWSWRRQASAPGDAARWARVDRRAAHRQPADRSNRLADRVPGRWRRRVKDNRSGDRPRSVACQERDVVDFDRPPLVPSCARSGEIVAQMINRRD